MLAPEIQQGLFTAENIGDLELTQDAFLAGAFFGATGFHDVYRGLWGHPTISRRGTRGQLSDTAINTRPSIKLKGYINMAQEGLGYLSDKLIQVAYVVEDFDEAFKFFREALGIEKFYVWDHITREQTEKIYRGKPGTFEFSAAYAYSGEVQIELCKHESGNNVYKDWIDEKGIGIHHVGYLLDDAEQYNRAFEHLSGQGFEVAMAGRYGDCRWSYFDTRAIVGSYTEIYWLPPEFKEIFDKIKAGIDPFV